MKVLFLLFTVCIFAVTVNGQTQKGNFLIGGSGNGYYTVEGFGQFYLQVNPKAGVFVAKNIAFTIDLPVSYQKINGPWGEYTKTLSAGVVPGLQFFSPLSERFFITPQFRTGYQFTRLDRTGRPWGGEFNYHILKLEAGAGFAWFITPTAAITFDIPYVANLNLSEARSNSGKIDLRLGFLVSIPSKKTTE